MTAKRRRKDRGFTLVELLVSLVAGLIVALAVVGIARDATNTFQEEQRTAIAEKGLRLAIDRIRSDIQRASYMSSPNRRTDRWISPDQKNVVTSEPTALTTLAGLHLTAPDPSTSTPLSVTNGLSPQVMEVWGNLTGTDQYVAQTTGSAGNCSGRRIVLQTDSPAMYRVLASSDPDDVLKKMFQPVDKEQFLVRIHDDYTRQSFYLPTCKGSQTAGVTGNQPYVDVAYDPTNVFPITPGRYTINPIVGVRWEIRPLTQSGDAVYASLATDPKATGDKYDLVREFIDATGALVGTPEVVTEFAVDLGFSFTADTGTYDYTTWTPTPNMVRYDFGASENVALTDTTTGTPQRIRSVRIRLATRGPFPDREQALALPANDPTNYPLRYCIVAAGCTKDRREWSRMRVLETEVTLPNQNGAFF